VVTKVSVPFSGWGTELVGSEVSVQGKLVGVGK